MRKIKLFPVPHVEVRINVSDEMEKDYAECQRKMRRGKVLRIPNCDKCSWEKLNVIGTCGCLYTSVQRQRGSVSDEIDG